MTYLVDITNPKGITSVEALGGKGCSLVKLTEGGFPVPEGFIITTYGYRVFANKLELIKKYSNLSKRTTFSLEDAEIISDEIYEIFSKSIYTISQYAVDIENYYKKPMDMEFCVYKEKMYIVQARPITTLLDLPNDLNPLSDEYKKIYHSYANFNCIQMLTVPWTYCSFSCVNNAMFKADTYVRWIDKEVANISNEYNKSDLPYYSSTIAMKPLIKAIFNIALPTIRSILWNWIFSFNPSRLCKEIKEKIDSLINYYNNILDELKNHKNTITLTSLRDTPFNIIMIIKELLPLLVPSLLAQSKINQIVLKYGIDEDEVERMFGGRRENIASRMDYAITQLHLLFIKCEEEETGFIEKLLTLSKNEEEERIKQYMISLSESPLTSHQQLYIQWNEFMNKFGGRGPGEIMISSPRYEDKPSIILLTILNTSYENVEEKSPDYLEKKADEAVDEICSKVSKKDAETIRYYLPVARLMLTYREHPKYVLISIFFCQRKLIIQLGHKMMKEGIIHDLQDVFHFSIDELCDYEQNKLDITKMTTLLQQRKSIYIRAKSISSPRIIVSPYASIVNISEQTKQELLDLSENILKGMPTSAGIVEGRAVVVLDPREGHLKKGDILVAPATDPGWTPLFVPASAVVIAIGGPLTHGSIVAREMGIPCVVNVQNLMEKVKTGMRIKVDGSKGTVEIL
ncbi:hypothetical protein WA158_004674 [Blastocystis sp. Blastoise]